MSQTYPTLFSSFRLGNVELKNRLVMAAMSTELGGLQGEVTPQMIAFYRARAAGGMGLIIVEYTCVDPDTGRAHEWQLTLESRRNLDGHIRLVRAVHEAGAKIFMQMQHSGQYSNAAVLPGGLPYGPSDIYSKKDPEKLTTKGFSAAEVEGLIEGFGRTAELAVEAGYDGVELHGAHGYLLTQFMSPLGNKRDDEWGGDEERRLRFPLAVVSRVKAALGDRPLVYRISADEFRTGGLTIDDMERIAPLLVAAGADAIHVSTGWGVGPAFAKVIEPMSTPEGWRIPYASRIRKAAGVPVITVGQIRWPETAEAALEADDCDLVALGRPMLADPEWAKKAQAGRRDLIRPCTSCNWCISPHEGRPYVGCAENPRTGSELDLILPSDTGAGRRADVVGAGPGGAVAALMLADAGFDTHLHEARDRIGGGIIPSATPPGKDKLFWYNEYLDARIKHSKIQVHLGSKASAESLIAAKPDLVIVAAGTARIDLPIEGSDDPMVMDAYDLLIGDRTIDVAEGGHVVVYGGGETGCETAEYMAHRGVRVSLVSRSPADKLARSADWVYRMGLIQRLTENPLVTIIGGSHVVSAKGGQVTLRNADGMETVLEADRLMLAQGRKSAGDLQDPLTDAGIPCALVGDSQKMGRIGDAVHAAYRAVQSVAAEFAKVPAASF